MEHVNDFPKALLDINRTLRPGGAHIFTTPTYIASQTVQWAWYNQGRIQWIYERNTTAIPWIRRLSG